MDQDELKAAEESAQQIAAGLHENLMHQAKLLANSLADDKDEGTFPEENWQSITSLLVHLHGVDKGSVNFAYKGGFRRTYVGDVEHWVRQTREIAIPRAAGINDPKVRDLCETAERACQEAEKVVAAVNPKFITEGKSRKKREE